MKSILVCLLLAVAVASAQSIYNHYYIGETDCSGKIISLAAQPKIIHRWCDRSTSWWKVYDLFELH